MLRSGRHASLFVSLALIASCSSLVGLDDLEPDDEVRAGAGGRLIEPMTGGEGGTGNGAGGKSGEGGEGAKSPLAQGGDGGEGDAGAAGASGNAGMGGSGGTLPNDCTEITVTYLSANNDLVDEYASFEFVVSPDIAGPGRDYLAVEFYWYDDLDGGATGAFQIEGSPDAQYVTCARCVHMQDQLSAEYLAISGTIVIDEDSDHMHGHPLAVLTDLTLIEVTINEDTFLSTPVPNGKCFHIESITLDKPPKGWDCDNDPTGGDDLGYYLDGKCDCGCGVVDADCESATDTCDVNRCTGSEPDPADNSQCL